MSIFVTVGLSWIFGFITSIVSQVFVVCQLFLVIFTITAPLQGFFIFVAYCLNKKVKTKWQGLFATCFPCCAVEGNETTSSKGGTHSTRGNNSSTANSRSQNSVGGRSY